MPGQELRVQEPPQEVVDPFELKRHEWVHLHRKVNLGEMERCKAELLEARKQLRNASVKLETEMKQDKLLKMAQRQLFNAKTRLDEELVLREKAGLSANVDPFDPNFNTGPVGGESDVLALPILLPPQPLRQDQSQQQTMLATACEVANPAPPATQAAATPVTRYFVASGNVQNVMFRQTLIRGAIKRGLSAGATNEADGTVSLTLHGQPEAVKQIARIVSSGKPLNDWGAIVDSLREVEAGDAAVRSCANHQVNTKNVDETEWKQDVAMYL